jgi:hypothetical protein
MTLKTLIAASLAAAFATLPFAVQAAGDKASAGATKSDGGAEAMFKSMDKNKDGSISKDEAKGTPHGERRYHVIGRCVRQQQVEVKDRLASRGPAGRRRARSARAR